MKGSAGSIICFLSKSVSDFYHETNFQTDQINNIIDIEFNDLINSLTRHDSEASVQHSEMNTVGTIITLWYFYFGVFLLCDISTLKRRLLLPAVSGSEIT